MTEVPSGPIQHGIKVNQAPPAPFMHSSVRVTVENATRGQNYRELYRINGQRKISLTDYSRSILRDLTLEARNLLQEEGTIGEVIATRAVLRTRRKATIDEIKAALKQEYRGSQRRIRQNPDFRQDLTRRVQESESLEKIALQKKMLDSLERSLRNAAEKVSLDAEIAKITDQQAEERRTQLIVNAQSKLDAETSEDAKKALATRIKRIQRMPVSMIRRALAENRLSASRNAPQTEGATEAQKQTIRAAQLTAKIQSETALQRVRRTISHKGKDALNFFKSLTRPAAAASAASLLLLFGTPILERATPAPNIPGITTARAEAPNHIQEAAIKGKPRQREQSQTTVKESPQVIAERRAESIKAIGGEERLSKLQEEAKAFTEPFDKFTNLKVRVGDKEYTVEAGFVEYSQDYKDINGNLPEGGGRATDSELQNIINRRASADSTLAQKIHNRDEAVDWVKRTQRIGLDCAGFVGGIYKAAYQKLGFGNFHNKIGIEHGNLDATAFLRMAKEGREGFYLLEDKAINILTPGTIIEFINDTDSNKTEHSMVVINVGIGEDGKLYAEIAQDTDVTGGREKGAHSFKMIIEDPNAPLAKQLTKGVVYDLGQLMEDDLALAKSLALQLGVDITGMTPDQVRQDARLQHVSYTARFFEKGYVIIGNRHFVIPLGKLEATLYQEYEKKLDRRGITT